jgi:hypothetical protein
MWISAPGADVPGDRWAQGGAGQVGQGDVARVKIGLAAGRLGGRVRRHRVEHNVDEVLAVREIGRFQHERHPPRLDEHAGLLADLPQHAGAEAFAVSGGAARQHPLIGGPPAQQHRIVAKHDR